MFDRVECISEIAINNELQFSRRLGLVYSTFGLSHQLIFPKIFQIKPPTMELLKQSVKSVQSLTVKIPKLSCVFVANFEQTIHFVPMFPLLALNK